MATRKEEKARLRAARLEAEQREAQAARKRLILGYGVAGVLTAAVLVGIVVVIAERRGRLGRGHAGRRPHRHRDGQHQRGRRPTLARAPRLRRFSNLDLENAAARRGLHPAAEPARRRKHATWSPERQAPDYHTNPPTSGNHVTTPFQQADGAYAKTPELIDFVHSLEHGRIEIQYAPDLPEADQLALKGVFDESPSGMLLFPNPEMPYEVAATAWTQLMGCKRYEGAKTLDAIRDFRDQYRGRGPERQVPITP